MTPERHPREWVHGRTPFARQPPKRDRLAVVALLNAGVEIGVAIERDEELGQQLLGSRDVEPSSVEIGGQVGPQVLVQTAKPDVVVPGEPDDRVEQPERLQCLVERARGFRGDVLEHARDVDLVEPTRLGRVASGERENGVDGLGRCIEELDRLRVAA